MLCLCFNSRWEVIGKIPTGRHKTEEFRYPKIHYFDYYEYKITSRCENCGAIKSFKIFYLDEPWRNPLESFNQPWMW